MKEGSRQSSQYLLGSAHASQINLRLVVCLLHEEKFPAYCLRVLAARDTLAILMQNCL